MIWKNNKFKRLKKIVIFSLILTITLSSNISSAQFEIIEAPLNPEFKRYLQEINNPSFNSYALEDYKNSLIPTVFTIEGDFAYNNEQFQGIEFPTRFDLREMNKLTPVKNRKSNGASWAFAAYGSLESLLMPNGQWDFSENHMKNTHGFEYGHSSGGNRDMATAYLARWSGPVLEEEDPFKEFEGTSPEGLLNIKQVQNVLYLPDRTNSLDNKQIKFALMEHGAIQSSYFYKKEFYNESTDSYYYNGQASNYNDSIAIIGWDDNYDKRKFNIAAPENGAFIARNSLGQDWGQEGYFYISYYDTKFGNDNTVYTNVVDRGYYDNIYQYDPLGITSSMGFGQDSHWFINVFTSEEEEDLFAASFYTIYEDLDYEIWVDNDLQGSNFSNLVKVSEGIIKTPGYHTVEFQSNRIEKDKKFAVAVKLTDTEKRATIPLEFPRKGFATPSANEEESYVGIEIGGKPVIYELTSIEDKYKDTNVCLKAFTRNIYQEARGIELDYENTILFKGQPKKLTARVLPEQGANQYVTWASDDSSIATVDGGIVRAKGIGKTSITATTMDGNHSATCQVTVSEYPVAIGDIDTNFDGISVDVIKASEDIEGIVIVQPYNKNNRSMRPKYRDLVMGQTTYNFNFDMKSISYIKVFIWDSLDNMKPLARYENIDIIK